MEYKGMSVAKGMSLGRAVVIKDFSMPVSSPNIKKGDEKKKLTIAIEHLIKEYDGVISNPNNSKDIIDLAEAYKMLIAAPSLYKEIINLVKKNKCDLIVAVNDVLTDKEQKMKNLESDYAKERAEDIKSLKLKLIKTILGVEDIDLASVDYDFILVSKEVTPTMLLTVNPKYIKGIISEYGSKTSHVTILSKNMGIPAIVNIKDVDKLINNNDNLFLDGNNGLFVNDLTDELITMYREKINNYEKINASLKEMLDKKATTFDGKTFEVASNAGDLNDLEKVIAIKSDGVGLFRSEFLYLNRDNPPSEELQFNAYKSFAMSLRKKPLIIRTIDIGGDKKSSFFEIPEEDNPFLGYRAIRYCLDHKEIFKTQLRAILRASNYGNVMIMYPMISSLEELRKANAILRETMADLTEDGIPYNDDIMVGIMVEVPSVASTPDLFIDEVDFFSIGTNDLTQYTVAVDRTNALVSKLYDAYNPAVIRMIKHTIEAKKDGKFVGMCGEMAADPAYIILLVGLGLDEFSVNMNSVLKVKKYISMLSSTDCEKVVEHVLTLKTGTAIKDYLDEVAGKIFGIYLDL